MAQVAVSSLPMENEASSESRMEVTFLMSALESLCKELAKSRVEVACIAMYEAEVFVVGTEKGRAFASARMDLQMDFAKYCAAEGLPETKPLSPGKGMQLNSGETEILRKAVADYFCLCYGKALGTTAMVPVPYEKMLRDQSAVGVEGLPEGVAFQHPENYDLETLKWILEYKAGISFTINRPFLGPADPQGGPGVLTDAERAMSLASESGGPIHVKMEPMEDSGISLKAAAASVKKESEDPNYYQYNMQESHRSSAINEVIEMQLPMEGNTNPSNTTSSAAGVEDLNIVQVTIPDNEKERLSSMEKIKQLREQVNDLFSRKFGEAIGVDFPVKVPYRKITFNPGCVVIDGMPPGVVFKAPGYLEISSLRRILDAAEFIKFTVIRPLPGLEFNNVILQNFGFSTMDLKKVSAKDSAERKKRMMCIELKKEIIAKHDQGVRVIDLAKQYERSTSTICTILKQKESIQATTPAKGIKIISKQRTSTHENMEKLLMVWLTEKQLAGETVTKAVICEKARAIYADLLQQTPGTSMDEASGEPFKASRGWFENFKKRTGIHSVVRHGEAASADIKAGEDHLKTFAEIIAAEGYIPQQVFNCDETGLFWKRMPRRTYITAEEKRLPGHQPMKDRLTLALCANASGDCKIKPLLVYHSENPRAFKSHKILKEKLQVMWRANPRAWVTRQIFVEWVNLVFGPGVKKYLQENNLPLQALLVLDNAPAHPPNLEDDILEEFKFIKVLYLPPNITPILQPMEQQVVSNFKKLFTKHLFRHCFEVTESTNLTLREFWKDHYNIVTCLRIIDMAWQGVTKRTLTCAWRKLWPEVVSETDFERLEPEAAVVEEIVSLGKSMGLDVDEGDINELMEEHSEELTTQELKELLTQQHTEVLQEIDDTEEEEEVISVSEIKEMLGVWEKLSDFIQKKHLEKIATGRAMELFNDTCLTHFRNILKGRMKQISLDRFLSKTVDERDESVAKRAKISK
ncbi:tigger transposable element-derived protein 1 isoform X1 [Myotis daubentonii]|uniref:tigger transposable element-derived protein 1 isoform X1 n=2 Tax=Myotis daubentonii TaxID=98922 RepID=UPI002872C0AB|nr:tigger transposable element-derived protein 1 isoform X1 [Myotis daubentonii]XP_059549400.1 tigger transposable element-derived protein 1 isoform X1 [Myotis daubentonii]